MAELNVLCLVKHNNQKIANANYVLLKALPHVCMENAAQSEYAVFFIQKWQYFKWFIVLCTSNNS